MVEASVGLRIWRLLRNTFFVLVGIAGLSVGYAWIEALLKERELAKVVVRLQHLAAICEDERRPLFVSIENGTDRTINETGFHFSARHPGHSKELVYLGTRYWDRIIQPGETMGACWDYPRLEAESDPEIDRVLKRTPILHSQKDKLEWSVRRGYITFAEDAK